MRRSLKDCAAQQFSSHEKVYSLLDTEIEPKVGTAKGQYGLHKITMGVCQSSEKQASQKIDREIEKSSLQKGCVKLLILGAGESGKSTILKQMRLVHGTGFTAEELEARKSIIYSNITGQLAVILGAMSYMGIDFENPDLQTAARIVTGVCDAGKETEPLTDGVIVAIKVLWADADVQHCYGRRSEYQLNDSTKYFIESVDRVSAPNYTPTAQDMLYSRVPTTGVVEISFTIQSCTFRVFDVGGQRSERKKWIHCFDDVDSVLYVVAISEYDQKLREDNKTNRLKEAMCLFESVCNSRFFAKAYMIVFFNKSDLFRYKVEQLKVPLSVCFPTYEDQQCYADAVASLARRFRLLPANMAQSLYLHETCATDSQQVQQVVASVTEQIVELALSTTGMV